PQPTRDVPPNTLEDPGGGRESPGPSEDPPGNTGGNPGVGGMCIPCGVTLLCAATEGMTTINVTVQLISIGQGACSVREQGQDTGVVVQCDGTLLENGSAVGQVTLDANGGYSACVTSDGGTTCLTCTMGEAADASAPQAGGGAQDAG